MFAGSSTDLEKCFDTILREVVIPIALVAGFPLQIAKAYVGFVSRLASARMVRYSRTRREDCGVLCVGKKKKPVRRRLNRKNPSKKQRRERKRNLKLNRESRGVNVNLRAPLK